MIALVEGIERPRRQMIPIAILAILVAGVALTHGGMAMDHPDDVALVCCVAIMETGALALSMAATPKPRPGPRQAAIPIVRDRPPSPGGPGGARASPVALQVLRL
jgi:hypothetical protein